jgi:hypothetical protein
MYSTIVTIWLSVGVDESFKALCIKWKPIWIIAMKNNRYFNLGGGGA